MHRFLQKFLHILAFLAFAADAYSAPFVAPAEENPPFRRDLLPIDTDSMAALSADLALLVNGIPLETAAERRAAAQSLALALALDPANSKARDMISELEEGKLLSPAKPNQLIQAKARVWQIHAWLELPEAGADGKLLGDLVGDAASVLDPSDPLASELRKSDEKGKWDDWVAPLAAFEKKALAKNDTDPFEDIDPDMPETVVPTVGKAAIKLKEGSVNSVLFVYDKESESWNLRPTSVEMTAVAEGSGEFAITVAGVALEQPAIAVSVSAPILTAVKALQGGVPADGLVSIATNGGGVYSLLLNQTSMTGPGFILANSAITGVEPGATVIARLDDGNNLVAPDFFWRLVSALEEGDGGRLVVPAGTEQYFTAMLTLEKPEFLLKYEVLVASTPQQFVELCAKAPSEKYAAPFASFQEIKTKGQDSAPGTYLANRFVRQRLLEIVEAAPFHLSARLLAQQGAGERPRSLSKRVLAAELWRAVAPIETLAILDIRMADAEFVTKMEKLYETMRAEVDLMERYADSGDRDLVNEGKDVTATVRTLARTLRGRTTDLIERYEAVTAAHLAMVSANTAFLAKLSELSGDPLPDKPGEVRPKRKRNRLPDN